MLRISDDERPKDSGVKGIVEWINAWGAEVESKALSGRKRARIENDADDP